VSDPPAERGRLYVVATPIGNLRDVTHRALEVLASVSLVAAEDTRLTRRLLDRYGVSARLVSFHARNAARRMPELLDRLRGGADLALVTDAGTPAVSDPGEELVTAWAAENGIVVPIPGASSVLAAVVGSAIAGPRWSFEGFLPRRGRERRERLARIAADDRATVVFEAPTRLAATLADLAAACGANRPGAVCRELTKIHEEFVRAPLGELADRAGDGRLTLRGEVVLVVGASRGVTDRGTGATPDAPRGSVAGSVAGSDPIALARAEVEALVVGGLSRSEAARRIADSTGIQRRLLYGAPRGR
jgi:16S rRNA (cytidine1402-2'-O)-methyltransferase